MCMSQAVLLGQVLDEIVARTHRLLSAQVTHGSSAFRGFLKVSVVYIYILNCIPQYCGRVQEME
jgi:hypothetical protein